MAYNNDYPPKVLQGKCGNEVVVVKEMLRKCSYRKHSAFCPAQTAQKEAKNTRFSDNIMTVKSLSFKFAICAFCNLRLIISYQNVI